MRSNNIPKDYNQRYIKKFPAITDGLNNKEIGLLKVLVEAAELMADVYKVQLNGKNEPQFYPVDATNQEIENAAKKDPAILSPYTIVERGLKGKLVAIPFHIKYKESLTPVSKKLEEAAEICPNKEYAEELSLIAKSLLTDEHDKAKAFRLKNKLYVLDAIFGPIERMEDERFFIKKSYQAWVGIMDKSLTERAQNFKDIVFTTRRKMAAKSEKVDFMDKAQIRVDNSVIFTGEIAKYNFTATTLPNELELLEKYGSKARIFLPAIKEQFYARHLPIFKSIFALHFQQSFTEEELRRGYLHTVMLHEIARVLVRYRHAASRLKDLYPIFNEMTVEALAIKLCGTLLLKDVISQKEMESILVMFLTRIFDYYFEMKDKPAVKMYVLGNSMLLNFLISNGAVRVAKDGISWPNFTKMFLSVSTVADEIEKVLAEGSYNGAKDYIDKYSSLAAFKQFKFNFDKTNPKK